MRNSLSADTGFFPRSRPAIANETRTGVFKREQYTMYIYIYTYIHTVSFHNFKSQVFKLSVSNPNNKSVAYVSVPSQISNCQSLGRKTNLKF